MLIHCRVIFLLSEVFFCEVFKNKKPVIPYISRAYKLSANSFSEEKISVLSGRFSIVFSPKKTGVQPAFLPASTSFEESPTIYDFSKLMLKSFCALRISPVGAFCSRTWFLILLFRQGSLNLGDEGSNKYRQ